jgi:hypothetical protein
MDHSNINISLWLENRPAGAIRIANQECLDKAKKLTKIQAENLLSRMGGNIGRRLDDKKLSPLEALAIQREVEDLNEWLEWFEALCVHANQLTPAQFTRRSSTRTQYAS